MVRKSNKKADKKEYSFITVEVTKYNVSVNARRNYELLNLDKCDIDEKVYNYETRLEIEGLCIYPDHLIDSTYSITLYGTDQKDERFSLKLKDCHVIDDKWQHMYKKVKGKEVPVYAVPDGVGYIDKQRGVNNWSGFTWVPPRIVTDMLTLLPHIKPLYLELHILKRDRLYTMVGLSLQNNNPV